jgi:hypothetical protein
MVKISLIGMLEAAKCSNKSLAPALSLEDNLLMRVSRWTTTEGSLGDQLHSRMGLFIPDSGSTVSEMDSVPRCGQTGLSTKANGKMIKRTAKEN